MRLFLLASCSVVVCVQAQPPAIGQNGITNAASRIPPALTGGAIARGARLHVSGVRLQTDDPDDPDSTHLWLMQAARRIALPLLDIREDEIESVIPADAALGPASLMVETSAGQSKPAPVRIVPVWPGIFSRSELGWGQGRIRYLNARGRWMANTISAPVPPGAAVLMDVTGVKDAKAVRVVVGGIDARVLGTRHSTEGIDQVRFQVPARTPQGCFVPVYLQAGNAPPSNVVSMAVDRGSDCSALHTSHKLQRRMGIVAITRTNALYSNSRPATLEEEALAIFSELAPVMSSMTTKDVFGQPGKEANPLLLFPPAGTCTAYYGTSQSGLPTLSSVAQAMGDTTRGYGMDAGRTLSIVSSSGSRSIPAVRGEAGTYNIRLGLEEQGLRPAPKLFLNDPGYTLSGGGGKDIDPFTVHLPGVPTFEWTNRDRAAVIDRRSGALFQWHDVPSDTFFLVLMSSADSLQAAGGACYCTADPAAGSLRVSPEMLSNLPATQDVPGPPVSMAYLIAARLKPTAVPGDRGLDALWTLSVYISARRVIYR